MSTVRRAALATLHGKERVIGPALAPLGVSLVVPDGVDTDALGTFTGDVPRAGTQLEAARRKARLGMERTGLPLGVASEGSFGPDATGLFAWNLELVVWLDDERGLEVVGRANGGASHQLDAEVRDVGGLLAFAARAGFPEHGLVVQVRGHPPRKGLVDERSLRAAFEEARALCPDEPVRVANDLRAHVHPTRMARIREAAEDLAARLSRTCAACGSPGPGPEGAVLGLPCGGCGRPTNQIRAQRWACPACGAQEERPVDGPAWGDPMWCPGCNP